MSIWAAYIFGFLGSLHCAGMCGPLAIAVPGSGRSSAGFVAGRIFYNLGRIITYCAIGVVFGLMGKSLVLAGIQRWLSITVGVLLLTGLLASRRLALSRPVIRLVERLKSGMAAVIHRRTLPSMLVLGMLNGLLPCGLVYVAAGAASLTGGVLSGMLFMLFFGLATVPMMLTIGLSRNLFPIAWRLKLLRLVPFSVFALGLLLILRGLSLGIPYISPILSGHSCCSSS